MHDIPENLITIVAGGGLILFRKRFIRNSLEFQNQRFGIRFGKKSINYGMWFVPAIGLLFIVIGVTSLFGIKL